MINWIKSIFCNKEEAPAYEPEPKQWRVGKNISEPIISFVKCVKENPKRFEAHSDTSLFVYASSMDLEQNTAYKIWDKESKKGWYVVGKYYSNQWFVNGYPGEGGPLYTDPFFLTEDEKEYTLREVKEIMGYRVERQTKLEQIRKDRRIRDERNRLKGVYCND